MSVSKYPSLDTAMTYLNRGQRAAALLRHPQKPDATVENHGSLFLVRPDSARASDWLSVHAPMDEEHQYFGDALVVEPRYVRDLVEGMRADGLVVP